MKKTGKKKIWIAVAAAAALAAVAFCVWYFFLRGGGSGQVYVMPVGDVAQFSSGSASRFTGMVEAQETVEFRKDSSKTIRETYVQEGDPVKKGDKLFSYDMDSVSLQIAQKKLDIQREQASITSNNELIRLTEDSLEKQRLRNQNQQTEYRIKALRNELESLENSMNNVDVICTVDGTVKSVSDGTDGSDVYISVMRSGDYLVKGKISELNLAQFPQGTPVTVRSRVDSRTWVGEVSRVDMDQTAGGNSGEYYVGGDESARSSKYYFYVDLQSSEGLFLGQHVIIEPAGSKSGLWLNEGYVVVDGGDAFVWADSNGRLKKKHVTLGEYDEAIGSWQILEGLSINDMIAYPEEGLSEGMRTTTEYGTADEPADEGMIIDMEDYAQPDMEFSEDIGIPEDGGEGYSEEPGASEGAEDGE